MVIHHTINYKKTREKYKERSEKLNTCLYSIGQMNKNLTCDIFSKNCCMSNKSGDMNGKHENKGLQPIDKEKIKKT